MRRRWLFVPALLAASLLPASILAAPQPASAVETLYLYETRNDNVHYSGGDASVHVWWVWTTSGPPSRTADVTSELQHRYRDPDTNQYVWATVGKIQFGFNRKPGSGSGIWTTNHQPCTGNATGTWRVKSTATVNPQPGDNILVTATNTSPSYPVPGCF